MLGPNSAAGDSHGMDFLAAGADFASPEEAVAEDSKTAAVEVQQTEILVDTAVGIQSVAAVGALALALGVKLVPAMSQVEEGEVETFQAVALQALQGR